MEEIKNVEVTLNTNKDTSNVSGKINKFIVVQFLVSPIVY